MTPTETMLNALRMIQETDGGAAPLYLIRKHYGNDADSLRIYPDDATVDEVAADLAARLRGKRSAYATLREVK